MALGYIRGSVLEEVRVDDVQSQLDGHVFRPPEGAVLRQGEYGLGLYTTRSFSAGDILYTTSWYTVAADDRVLRALVEVDGTVQEMELTRKHSVRSVGGRILDIPGCFMNHSCEPTTVSMDHAVEGDGDPSYYHQVVLVDLEPGDHITCDYLIFDWDCDGHQFTCECGSDQCYGEIAGFSGLPREEQERIADRIAWDVRRLWEQSQQPST